MKAHIWLLALLVLVLGACSVGRTTESRGLENQAYLQFVRGNTDKYSDGVDVYIDDAQPFKAKVDKVDSRTVKGNTYVIKSGKRHLKVEHNGTVLYEKDIIVTTQETRKVQLP